MRRMTSTRRTKRANRCRPNAAVTDFRQLHAVVVHPRDSNGELLIRQLQRFGCRVDNLWPPVGRSSANVDVVLCLVDSQNAPARQFGPNDPNAAHGGGRRAGRPR